MSGRIRTPCNESDVFEHRDDSPVLFRRLRWTPEMDRYLADNVHRLSLRTLSRKLRKSRRAVQQRAVFLGVSKLSDDHGYTVRDVVVALGTSSARVVRWIEEGRLRAARRQTDHPRDPWLVSPRDLRAFLLAYPDEVDLGRVEKVGGKHLLFDLLSSAGHGANAFGLTDCEREKLDRMLVARLPDDGEE